MENNIKELIYKEDEMYREYKKRDTKSFKEKMEILNRLLTSTK